MRSTAKSQKMSVLTADLNVETPQKIPERDIATCVIIDGHALIQSLGKPQSCKTFRDYAKVFADVVVNNFSDKTTRVDVVFDRYLGKRSKKASTRSKRTGKRRPIRKAIDSPDVPLPQSWDQFMALDENKADLAEFLSHEILSRSVSIPDGATLEAAGGFKDPENTKANTFDAKDLCVDHEEADTRIIIHAKSAISSGYGRIVVKCKDTDVLLLLLYHVGSVSVETWMVSGTSKSMKCFPVHSIAMKLDTAVLHNLLGFHSLTGCDTTSSLSGISKKFCWKRYVESPELLEAVGRDGTPEDIERYLCRLYGCSAETHAPDIDICRYRLFMKARKALELLPPTRDALQLHLARCNEQAKIWISADDPTFTAEDPERCGGWKDDGEGLKPVWMRLAAVPSACTQLISCGCKTKCSTSRCKCYRSGQVCMFECACEAIDCANPIGFEDILQDIDQDDMV